MKYWNITAWIKTIIIVVMSAHYVVVPMSTNQTATLFDFILPLLIGIVSAPATVKLNFFRITIEKPHWNDNPFKLRKLLILLQFISIMAIAFGLTSMISGSIQYSRIDLMAPMLLGYGLGLYMGMLLLLRLSSRKQSEP